MLGLALESAGQQASAALWSGAAGKSFALLGSETLSPEAGKADQLISVIEQLLETTGSTYQALDVIAVNRGPGSFTGIRSAVALGRGLALATSCPVIAVTTHEAMAAGIGAQTAVDPIGRLMIAMDARRGQVYCQGFDADFQAIDDLGLEAPDAAAVRLDGGGWLLSGSGATLVQAQLSDPDSVTLLDDVRLDARCVAMAASAFLGKGEKPVAGFDLTPLYVRPPDAIRPKPFMTPRAEAVEAGG